MKFSVLSGAYINAGDFLIVERSLRLLKKVYPECELTIYKRDKNLSSVLSEINKTDAVVLAGGPAYKPNIYPNEIPLVENLDDIKVPIFTLGQGWYGNDDGEETINNYCFSDETKQLLKRLEKDSKLSCRDIISMRILRNNGFYNSILTGCPAWYDCEFLEKNDLNRRCYLYNTKMETIQRNMSGERDGVNVDGGGGIKFVFLNLREVKVIFKY